MKRIARTMVALVLSTGAVTAAVPTQARAQEACTQTVIYYPPFEPPGFNTGPVSCDVCPAGVQNWVNVYRGIIILYTCTYR